MPRFYRSQPKVYVNTDNLIPMECCNKHFLHPQKPWIYSKSHSIYLRIHTNNRGYQVNHWDGNIQVSTWVSLAEIRAIQLQQQTTPRDKIIGDRPSVEMIR